MKSVLIAGGGLAGHQLAYQLQKHARVTLIDPKNYFEIPMALPRLLVEPSRMRDALIPYTEFLPFVDHVAGLLTQVNPDSVVVKTSESASEHILPFDYLVLATGSRYEHSWIKPFGGDLLARDAILGQAHDTLLSAQSVLIVGGGPVGVEIAGEITQEYPDKRVTLVHSGSNLLSGTSQKAQAYALAYLQKKGVRVMLNQKVMLPADFSGNPPSQVLLSSGERLTGDLLYWCAGTKVNTAYMRPSFADTLDEKGLILTDAYLRVRGTENLFAVGDITALAENKMGVWAEKHAAVVYRNLIALLKGTPPTKTYRAATENKLMLVTLGRKHGVGYLPFGTVTSGYLLRKLKAEDMFITRYRKAMGLSSSFPRISPKDQ